MKKCKRCLKDKRLDEFNVSNKNVDGLSKNCSTCTEKCRTTYKNWNDKDPAKRAKITKERRDRCRKHVLNYLLTHPCVSCGESDPIVLEFDHLSDKTGNVSKMASHGIGLDTLQKEIDKCQILCANCHRRKTAKDYNWYTDVWDEIVNNKKSHTQLGGDSRKNKTMNTDKVTVSLVRDGNGNVDVPGTLAGFQTDLQNYTLREQADLEQIRDAVAGFWNEQAVTVKSVSMDALASAVFAKLNMPVSTYADATNRIKNYIRTATDTYAVLRGKDGGVQLRARLTTEELAKVDAQAAKLAAKKSA